jgi:hypothetical protein
VPDARVEVIRTGDSRRKGDGVQSRRKGDGDEGRHEGSGRIRQSSQYGDVVVTGRHKKGKGRPEGADERGRATDPVTAGGANRPVMGDSPKDSTRKKSASDSLRTKAVTDSLRKKPGNDSTRKKPATPAPATPEKEKEKIKGFVAGLGLNHVFPVGGQQVSSFNSGGTTGTLSDYIPVPMVRYYFSEKLYVQMEAQFNAPQYAGKNVVIQATPISLGPNRVLTNTVSVQKLFYFNVPLSVHYSPIDNLSIGVGLQYSRLRNAVGQTDSTITNTFSTPVDSLVGKHIITLKTSPAYQLISTNEFRVLLDANYTYKHFVLGFRYNQALSNFVNVQLGSGAVTQARNSSLQLYLRYILWDQRKKK